MQDKKIEVQEVNTTYTVGEFKINVLEAFDGSDLSVFQDGNIVTTYSCWSEALELADALQTLHAQIIKNCEMCNAYQDNKTYKFCPKHQ